MPVHERRDWSERLRQEVLADRGGAALAHRLAEQLRLCIADGSLAAGDVLPGARSLARQIAVHRHTVAAAYEALARIGWLELRPRFSPRVHAQAPFSSLQLAQKGFASVAYALPAHTSDARLSRRGHRKDELDLSAGVPDPRLIPVKELARAYRRALSSRSAGALLSYRDSQGEHTLRTAIAAMLRENRRVPAQAENILITRGSQNALWLACHAALRPGDQVAVEAFGYAPAWAAIQSTGAIVHAVPVDDQGLDTCALERLQDQHPLRAIYLTPHHQFPTTVTLSADRRRSLLEMAKRYGWMVLEDDYDHELHYDGAPVLPLASSDGGQHVVYLGTFSKVLAPGLRLGYVAAPPELMDRMCDLRVIVDRQGNAPLEHAVAELIEDGALRRHLARLRRSGRERRDSMSAALRRYLPDLEFKIPRGGMSIWAETSVNAASLVKECAGVGIGLRDASSFSFKGAPANAIRLCFAQWQPDEIEDAVQRLGEAYGRV